MSIKVKSFILVSCVVISCTTSSNISPEEETYDYLINELSLSEEENSVFILQNPRTKCGSCINLGNRITDKFSTVPAITTLDRKNLIRSEVCIIDTSGLVFELLPSTLESFALFKEGEQLTFIQLSNENFKEIEIKTEQLTLN